MCVCVCVYMCVCVYLCLDKSFLERRYMYIDRQINR